MLHLFARLKRGATIEQAEAELASAGRVGRRRAS